MNINDIIVGQSYVIIDIKRIGRDAVINGLTVNKAYEVLATNLMGDICTIINDVGRRVQLKAFRFSPIPEFILDLGVDFPVEFVMDVHAKLLPRKVPFKWEVGAKVILRNEEAAWFKHNPIRNNPGWVVGEMDVLCGKVCTVSMIGVGNGDSVRLEECNRHFSWAKEWFIPAEEQPLEDEPKKFKEPPIPKPKYKRNDIVAVERKEGKWIEAMDETIGETIVIASQIGDDIYLCDNGFYYSVGALRLATEEEKKLVKAAMLRKAQEDNLPVMRAKADGVSSFCIFTEFIGQIAAHNIFAGVCHADLNRYRYQGNIIGITDYLYAYETQVNEAHHADYKAYVDYIINRSPWHISYKKSSVDRALKEGLHMKVDKIPGKIIGASCVALRMGKEFSKERLPIYTMVVNAGYDEGVAFLVQHAFVKTPKGVSLSIGTGAHTVLDGDTKIGPVVSLMRLGYDESSLKGDSYVKKASYTGFTGQLSIQKDYLKEHKRFHGAVYEVCPGETTGTGFRKVTTHTEKDVFALADYFTKLFHKLDVMEF